MALQQFVTSNHIEVATDFHILFHKTVPKRETFDNDFILDYATVQDIRVRFYSSEASNPGFVTALSNVNYVCDYTREFKF